MLTDIQLRRIKPTDKPQKLSDGGGLFLLVTVQGGKLWRLAYRFAGKQKTLSIGEYPIVSLTDARAKREEAKRQLVNGITHQRPNKPLRRQCRARWPIALK